MIYLKKSLLILFIQASLCSCVAANEPKFYPQTLSESKSLNTGGFLSLSPTFAQSLTKKTNAAFGLSSLKTHSSENLTLSVTFYDSPTRITGVLSISTLKLTLDGEEFIYKNRNSNGDSKLLNNKYYLSEITKKYQIPKDVFFKLIDSKSSFYEVDTYTSNGIYTNKGYFKNNKKKSRAYDSFLKFNNLLTTGE